MGKFKSIGLRRLVAALSATLLQWGAAGAVETGDGVMAAPEDKKSDLADKRLPSVVVVGKRASMMSAQEIKRDKAEIVDSIVAEDIGKLPDFSVTEALQRVTGVQISRDRGEGGTVAIRGLTQIETSLNGREVFTAGPGRNLDFSDIPSGMVSGIDVYKTPSADHIEGGMGGAIDVRTPRPFDFSGREIAGSARLIHGDLARGTKPQFSVLASDRWKTAPGSEIGLLVNFSHQQRAWREDQKSPGAPTARTDILPGQTVVAPNGTSETVSVGERERTAGNVVMQWRPAANLELYAEGSHVEFRTRQDSHQVNVAASRSFAPGSVSLFPGTNDVKGITWTNAPLSILSFARDTVDRTSQGAIGGRWSSGALSVKADVSHTASYNNLFFSGPFLGGTTANFTHDLSTKVPGTSIGGTDLLDPGNLQYTGLAYRTRPYNGKLTAARLDGEYQLLDGMIESIAGGVRLARRRADNAHGLIFADASIAGISAAANPAYVMPNPYSNFLGGESSSSFGNTLTGNLFNARDASALRQAFGVTAAIPSGGDPLGVWRIGEDTQAAYVMARFGAGDIPLDGNAGLRVVHTREAASGNQSVPGSPAVAPTTLGSSYTDYLPSVNLRYRLREGLYLRGSSSKSITRPNFDQLSPSLTLNANPITPSLNAGQAGNPDLRPVRSSNFDVAVERYFNPSTSAFANVFLKDVDGFVTTVSQPEAHNGVVYQVRRPLNTDRGRIRGAEFGWQQFFDFLPGWLSGFGIQANYTYVDGSAPSSILGGSLPLQNLSRHSANIVGMYERGRMSARVAYNWRDKFLSEVTSIVGVGTLPSYTRAYGWLDASFSYRVSEKVSLAVEGANLLKTVRTSYYGVETRPRSAWLNDRQLSLSASIRF